MECRLELSKNGKKSKMQLLDFVTVLYYPSTGETLSKMGVKWG